MRSRKVKFFAELLAAALVIGGCGGAENPAAPDGAALEEQSGIGADNSSADGGNTADGTAAGADADEESTTAGGGDAGEQAAEASAKEPWEDNPLQIIDDNYRTYYEVFVYSFCDSDGDGENAYFILLCVCAHG